MGKINILTYLFFHKLSDALPLKSHHVVGGVRFFQVAGLFLGQFHIVQPNHGLFQMVQLGSPQNRRGDDGLLSSHAREI